MPSTKCCVEVVTDFFNTGVGVEDTFGELGTTGATLLAVFFLAGGIENRELFGEVV